MSLVYFKHEKTGLIKESPVGFSWTTFFFGFFVPIFRGAWLLAIICILVSVVTVGIAWLVFPFIINKLYIKHLLESGYIPKDTNDFVQLKSIGVEFGGKTFETPEQKSLIEKTILKNNTKGTQLRRTILGGLLGLPIGIIFLMLTAESGFRLVIRTWIFRTEYPSAIEHLLFITFFMIVCAFLGRELAEIGSNKTKK